jgi:predicted LPLAT superfamily acyltransferase
VTPRGNKDEERFPDFHPFSWFKKKERFSQIQLSLVSQVSRRFLRTLFQSLLRVSLFCLCSHAHRWYAQELLDVNSTQSKREREREYYIRVESKEIRERVE